MNIDRLDPIIRPANREDCAAIDEIYNGYVRRSTCTYQEEPDPPGDRIRWLLDRDPIAHPVVVAEIAGVVAGYGALSPFHRRSGYRRTVEDAVYVRPDLQRRGIGFRLLDDLIDRAATARHHAVVAVIDSAQAASIALHVRAGFAHAGDLREVGFKFGRWLDVSYYQRLL